MLTELSIKDIVLIERLDLAFAAGLSVLTGETGAGKSILLDAFALALGARGDAALVRQGVDQGQVIAMFELPPSHPVRARLRESDINIATGEAIILRRGALDVPLAGGVTVAGTTTFATASVSTLTASASGSIASIRRSTAAAVFESIAPLLSRSTRTTCC